MLMKNAISLMGRSEDVYGMTSNMMHLLPPKPSRQEDFKDLVMNFMHDQEDKVKQLKEYICVIGSDVMQLSSEIIERLKEEIKIKENGVKKIENITSTPQVLPSFEENTPPVTYSEEVEEIIGIPIEPQPQPLYSYPSLDVSLGDERGLEPPIKPLSPDSFRMKVVDLLGIHTPHSPHLASFHPKDTYCYYHPCIDDPKKYYGFKPGLLGHSGSLGVDFSKLKMIKDDLKLESKKVSFRERALNSLPFLN
nr:ribonuclease H-like domain-containing protein [Tanacetum cinerariifolium]